MSIYDEIKNELNMVLTENGDIAYSTTGSLVYDLIATVGALRFNHKAISTRFLKAFSHDARSTIKVLFYIRDIIDGLGERDTFRNLLSLIAQTMPEVALQIIPHIKDYGRFDDYLVLLSTNLAGEVASYLKSIIETKNNQTILLAKWLPSINASNPQTRLMARKLCTLWGYSYKEYRTMLSKLRAGNVLETFLSKNDFTFDYKKVPGQAFLKYNVMFHHKDGKRLTDYIYRVREGSAKINTKTISAYQVTRNVSKRELPNEALNSVFEDIMKKYPEIDGNTIVVRDGSSSMYSGGQPKPIDIANSLSILFAGKITGPLHNSFITFSKVAQLVSFDDNWSLERKLSFLQYYNDCSNTNIGNVYKLLLSLATNGNIKPEEAIKRVIIISDMEFDANVFGGSNLDYYRNKFNKLGLELPSLIFWCVQNRHNSVAVLKNDKNCLAISGYSQNILKPILAGTSIDFDIIIKELLKKYSFVDEFEL
jgi:hypothetical protein